MADTERIPLKYQSGWVDVKTRWTYGDKNAFLESKVSAGRAMLYGLTVAWDKGPTPSPEDLDTLDDRDAEAIIDRIAQLRKEQLGDLNDPNSSRASSSTSPEERSGPSTDGSAAPSSPSN